MSEPPSHLPPIIVITGPTAVGKSAVALELASRFGAEILSADSRQVYRYLDIGTAKPTAGEQALVPHHLIDIIDPDQPYSVARFRDDADAVLAGLGERGKVAFIVGGSPHYLKAVVDRWEPPAVAPQVEFRLEMEALARAEGAAALHLMLAEVDPEGARQIAGTNVRRVIRALEVYQATGKPFSEVGRRRGEPLPALRLAITMGRSDLHKRVDDRVDQQIRDGLIDEARRVVEMGFSPSLPPLAGLVYREAIAAALGHLSLEDAARRMKETTHRFVRHQYTWFRRDPSLEWLEAGPDLVGEVERRIDGYLSGFVAKRA